MTIGELLIAITSFCSAHGVTFTYKAQCIRRLYSCSIQKGPSDYAQEYLQCLEDGKWK